MAIRSFARVCALSLSVCASAAGGATFEKISADGGLGRVELKQLRSNAAGEFVAVSNSRVFAGSAKEKTVYQVLAEDNASFVLSATATLPVAGQTVNIGLEVYDTRLDLNANGDFVVASGRYVWAGNVREKAVRRIADAGPLAFIQRVLLNDAGQYLIVAEDRLLGGRLTDAAATVLVGDAVGLFATLDIYAYSYTVSALAGERRAALNAKGRFVAVTGRAVYTGDLAALTVEKIHEERAFFRHVSVEEDGTFVVTSEQDVWAGAL